MDAAEQVLDHDRIFEPAEVIICCSDETPQEHANDHEKGVRFEIYSRWRGRSDWRSKQSDFAVGMDSGRSDASDSHATKDVIAGDRTTARQTGERSILADCLYATADSADLDA